MSDNGTSATDIITYIGVPLAVLGGKVVTAVKRCDSHLTVKQFCPFYTTHLQL